MQTRRNQQRERETYELLESVSHLRADRFKGGEENEIWPLLS